jgi:dedicator of cytokinesis protein 3
MSFHETLTRFFRTNFHDEIQRLPVEGISGLEDELPINAGLRSPTRPSQDGGGVDDWPGRHMRSDSLTATMSMTNGGSFPPATAIVGNPSFYLPPLAFGQVPGAGVPPPPPVPTGSTGPNRQTNTGRTTAQTPLQRNMARLTRYGMSSITSGPGDRTGQTEKTIVGSEEEATSPQGSLINVGQPGAAPSVSRVSFQATARDVASTISATAKSRISRMNSFSWKR